MTRTMLKHGPNIRLVQELTSAGVKFLIIGGYAVACHGCRNPDEVDDLDLLLEPSAENAQKFVEVIRQIEPGIKLCAHQVARRGLHIRMKDRTFYLDVLTPAKDVDFHAIYDRSDNTTFQDGVRAQVISSNDLMDMKRRTIQQLTEETRKHENDLRCLEAT
jgi:hypothetical protein